MKKTRIINIVFITSVIGILVLLAALIYLKSSPDKMTFLEPKRYVLALQQYSQDLQHQGKDLPRTISVEELIQEGYLTQTDVQPFEGADVTFHTSFNKAIPESVLLEVHMPDDSILVQLGDGSVQQVTETRLKNYLNNNDMQVD